MSKKRVVVTGMSVLAPGAKTLDQFEYNLRNGVSGISHVQEMEDLGLNCNISGLYPDIDEEVDDLLFEYNSKKVSQFIKTSLYVGSRAWENAGFGNSREQNEVYHPNKGLIFGAVLGAIDLLSEHIIKMVDAKKSKRLGSTMVEQTMLSGPSAFVSGLLGLGNKVVTISNACSTGTESVIEGAERIAEGKADVMLCGSAEIYSPYTLACFDSLRVLNKDSNDNPTNGSRPMSSTASGFVAGSGAAMLVLEEYEHAMKRNANIIAEIKGWSVNCGGQRQGGSMTAPNKSSVVKCIEDTLKMSGINAKEIDLINGHLSSTMADPIEIYNWSKALKLERKDFPYIQSTKSMIGHCLGAAGSVELVASLLQMKQGFIHPSINCHQTNVNILKIIDDSRIVKKCINNSVNHLIKASFGFGDVNSSIVFSKKNIK